VTVDLRTVAVSLAVGLLLSLVYFGLLALMTFGLRTLNTKQAALIVTASLPFRLALLAIGMIWLIRYSGLVGALAMIPSIMFGRFLTHRVVRRWQG
jgi:uncharacterized membrane protein (DUF485 family)